MKRFIFLVVLLAAVFAINGRTAASPASDFSVVYSGRFGFSRETSIECRVRLMVKNGTHIRLEREWPSVVSVNGVERITKALNVTIIRLDENRMWVLNALRGTYGEQTFTPTDPLMNWLLSKKAAMSTAMGKENVLGYECELHQSVSAGSTYWVASVGGLGIPLREEVKGMIRLEARQIEFTEQDNALFRVPPGYQRAFHIEPVTYVDENYVELGTFMPALLDMTRVKVTRNEKGQRDINVWIRMEEFRKQLGEGGASGADGNTYAYTLYNFLFRENGMVCILSESDYARNGQVLQNTIHQSPEWREIGINSVLGAILDELMVYIKANDGIFGN